MWPAAKPQRLEIHGADNRQELRATHVDLLGVMYVGQGPFSPVSLAITARPVREDLKREGGGAVRIMSYRGV